MPKIIKASKDRAEKEGVTEFIMSPDRRKERVNAENMMSYYSNSVEIGSSVWDFRLKCGEMLDATPEKIVIKDLCIVYMSPNHAKAVSILLARQIKAYEDRFGEITVPPL